MSLTPGTRLGVYEILGPLGAGGMGEVYRARDTRLGREIAIKVIPRHLASTPEVRARFEREARVISSLNHPNICTLHDVGHEGDTDFLVLELVDGESLADRLTRGPMPAADLLRAGIQIADALEKAHRAGIVHRDLKPGNVMLGKTGVKLLDFGLARGTAGGPAPAADTELPTMSRPITASGTILGTFQYMAPEQLEGRDADARTDIWALGCVLYEMATGKQAFTGRSQASLISSIMSQEPPPVPDLAPLTPPALDRLIKACLAKDPGERIQTAHDVKLQLQWIAEGGSQFGVPAPVAARRRGRERAAWIVAAVATLAAIALAVVVLRPKPPRRSVAFELTPPPGLLQIDLPRISPDGSCLAFNAIDSTGTTHIWFRRMDTLEASQLPGTESATRPFWSPDSRYLAFFKGGKLYKIDTIGGPPIVLCEAATGADGSWGTRGVILFDGSVRDSVRVVSASGGLPRGAARIDRAHGETYNAWPQFLPDGRHFLYLAYGQGESDRTLKVGSIDSPATKSLGPATSRVEYGSGYLLYVNTGTLLAQPFDAGGIRLQGDPFPLAQDVESDASGSARFSTSTNGTLVYRSGGSTEQSRMAWVGRDGKILSTLSTAADFDTPSLSPDETTVAIGRGEGTTPFRGLWLWDLRRDLGTQFDDATQALVVPVWSPDGRRLAYTRADHGEMQIVVRGLDGGPPTVLASSSEFKVPNCWTRDGRWIVFMTRHAARGSTIDVEAFDLNQPTGSPPVPILSLPSNTSQATVSPGGSLMAYTASGAGPLQVYVTSFPKPGAKWRISTDGGMQPSWRGDGRELYYLTPGQQLMSVSVEPGSPPRFSRPRALFKAPVILRVLTRDVYLPTHDGQKFLMLTPAQKATVGATTVILDWLTRMERK
ncbi:MAG: protein kinase domain-containing protein [Hyphomicrobiales bacterium]